MMTHRNILILGLGFTLTTGALASGALPKPVVSDLREVMVTEAYSVVLNETLARQFPEQTPQFARVADQSRARFEAHLAQLKSEPASDWPDRQALGAAIELKDSYAMAATRARARQDGASATHFRELMVEAIRERDRLGTQLRAAAAKPR